MSYDFSDLVKEDKFNIRKFKFINLEGNYLLYKRVIKGDFHVTIFKIFVP